MTMVPSVSIGMDVGDKDRRVRVLDQEGKILCEPALHAKGPVVSLFFSRSPGARVALEVGRHSPWISRLLEGLGLEAIMANAQGAADWPERTQERPDGCRAAASAVAKRPTLPTLARTARSSLSRECQPAIVEAMPLSGLSPNHPDPERPRRVPWRASRATPFLRLQRSPGWT